jgi:hypothetical protein
MWGRTGLKEIEKTLGEEEGERDTYSRLCPQLELGRVGALVERASHPGHSSTGGLTGDSGPRRLFPANPHPQELDRLGKCVHW